MQRQLTLRISVKIDNATEEDVLESIKTNPRDFFRLLLVPEQYIAVSIGNGKSVKLDKIIDFEFEKEESIWEQVIETSEEGEEDDYTEIIKNLHANADLQTDWEVTFVEDMMDRVRNGFDMRKLSVKQREWIEKLRDRYL